MRILKAVMTAAAVCGLITTGVMGQTVDDGEIEVNIHVQPFVEVEVIDEAVNWDVAGTSDADTDMGFHSGEEAQFEVRANAQHTITIESSRGTWQATNLLAPPWDEYEQVKFENTADDSFIGGSLYLIDVSSPGGSLYWNGDEGNIVNDGLPAGTKTWGIAADGNPDLYGDGDNLGGIEGALAPEGTYQTDAQITASVD